MSIRNHILSLYGLTPESTREAILFDATGEIGRINVTADDCFQTISCPSYWSLFRLADYVSRNYPQATKCTFGKAVA